MYEHIGSISFSGLLYASSLSVIKLPNTIKLCGKEDNHCFCCNYVAIVLTGLERAGCSCADPASKLGRCKHAVGLLLWCKNEKNVRYLDAIWEFYVFLSIDISVRYYLNHGKHGLTEMTNQCPVKWH